MTDRRKGADQKKTIAAARVALAKAVIATRKKIWTDSVIDSWLPYPLYRVDSSSRKVVFANAIEISITRTGRINRKALRPDVPHGFLSLPMDQLPTRWAAELAYSYYTQCEDALDLFKPCPKGWGQVRRAARKVFKLAKGVPNFDLFSLRNWVRLRCPFSPARMAGIKKIDAVGRLFKAEVGRMIESLPGPAMIKNSFFWFGPVKTLDPIIWNRLVSLLPLYSHLKQENKRLATPYVVANCWEWLTKKSGRTGTKPPVAATIDPRQAIFTWRASLLEKGLTPGGWRWLAKLSPPQLMALLKEHIDLIPLINLIVERQLPAHIQVSFWKDGWERFLLNRHPSPAFIALFEAVIRHRYNHRKSFGTGKVRRDLEQECWVKIRDVFDYLAPQDDQRPPPENVLAQIGLEWPNPEYVNEGAMLQVPKGASFEWFIRRSKEWHAKMGHVWEARHHVLVAVRAYEEQHHQEVADLRRQAMERTSWNSLITETTINGYEVISLTSGMSLAEEGALMRHCVASYVHLCAEDGHRIFSIRKNGRNLATLEIGPQRSGYVALQVRGKCNSPVPREVNEVAAIVARSYSDLARQAEKQAA